MSTKVKIWLIVEVLVLVLLIWKTFHVGEGDPGFYFNAGAALVVCSVVLGDVRNPTRLARLGMTFEGIYKDVKSGNEKKNLFEQMFLLVGFVLLAFSAYKFFT